MATLRGTNAIAGAVADVDFRFTEAGGMQPALTALGADPEALTRTAVVRSVRPSLVAHGLDDLTTTDSLPDAVRAFVPYLASQWIAGVATGILLAAGDGPVGRAAVDQDKLSAATHLVDVETDIVMLWDSLSVDADAARTVAAARARLLVTSDEELAGLAGGENDVVTALAAVWLDGFAVGIVAGNLRPAG